MTFTYNDIRLTYNSTLSTYNGADYCLPINAVDDISISENFNRTELDLILIFNSLNISEFVTISMGNLGGISTSDQISLSEFIYDNGLTLGNISKYDSINLSEYLNDEQVSNITKSDSINISEFLTPKSDLPDIYKYDVVNISENITSVATLSNISTSNSINISESLNEELVSNVRSSDQINISEGINLTGQSFLTVNENILLTERITSVASLADIITNTPISLYEYLHPELQSNVHSSDLINSTESINMESFRFSPSDIKPVGKVNNKRPDDGKLSGFF